MKTANDKVLRAAVYARYSTENQREASIGDQFRECERVAQREGMEVVARFSDEGISGGTVERPGYQNMLTAARQHEFDVLISEDIDRLWRNRAEFGPRSAELEDLGIAWLSCVADDTRRDGWGMMIQIKQAMAEAERRKASYRTRRGHRGKAEKGKSTGGKAFGYVPGVDSEGAKIRVIDPATAPIVKQIYEWRAAGASGQEIARRLNAAGVPPPGATWKRTDTGPNRKNSANGWTHSCIVGDPKRGVGILNNVSYRGEVVWSRTTWPASARDSAKRLVKAVAATEWVVRHNESLRIVSDELWDRVHAIQTTSSPRREAVRLGVAKRSFRFRSKYLLGGTLVCGVCGSNYIGDGYTDYLCPTHTTGHCANPMRFRRDDIHQAVFDLLTVHLLSDEALARGRAYLEAALREEQRQEEEARRMAVDGAAMRRLDEEAAAVRAMKLRPAAIAASLAEIEGERQELLAYAGGRCPAKTNRAQRLLSRLPDIVTEYKRLVGDAVKALAKAEVVEAAGEAVRRLLVDGRITLVPNAEYTGVVGPAHFKELGDHVLELDGGRRRCNLLNSNEKLSGSGGEISVVLWQPPSVLIAQAWPRVIGEKGAPRTLGV